MRKPWIQLSRALFQYKKNKFSGSVFASYKVEIFLGSLLRLATVTEVVRRGSKIWSYVSAATAAIIVGTHRLFGFDYDVYLSLILSVATLFSYHPLSEYNNTWRFDRHSFAVYTWRCLVAAKRWEDKLWFMDIAYLLCVLLRCFHWVSTPRHSDPSTVTSAVEEQMCSCRDRSSSEQTIRWSMWWNDSSIEDWACSVWLRWLWCFTADFWWSPQQAAKNKMTKDERLFNTQSCDWFLSACRDLCWVWFSDL